MGQATCDRSANMDGIMETCQLVRLAGLLQSLQSSSSKANFRCEFAFIHVELILAGREELGIGPDENLRQFLQFAAAGRKLVQQLHEICKYIRCIDLRSTHKLNHWFGPRVTCFSDISCRG
jgi:hypothetical protein